MAILTIAKNQKNEDCIYPTEQDLWNLLSYCNRKSIYNISNNLQPLNLECIYNQMIYIQNWRYKPLRTRALHYILSFDSWKYERTVSESDITVLMMILKDEIFKEYQSIMFLHLDKRNHYHIHIVVNPVNIYTLHVCRDGWIQIGNRIAYWLGHEGIALQGFTCQDANGKIVRDNGSTCVLYQQKYNKKYGIHAAR